MVSTTSHGYLTQKFIIGGIALALALNTLVAFTLPHVEPDLWGHVQYGRDFLENGLSRTTTYSYTAEGHRWINHENLSEIAFATIVDAWGIRGLALSRTLLGLIIVAAIAWRAGRASSADSSENDDLTSSKFCWPIVGLTTLLLSLALTSYWQIRPQIFSIALFTAMLLMLSRHVRQLRRDAWLIPPLLLVWTNTHGAFLAGVCIFAAYFALRGVGIFVRERSAGYRSIGQMAVLATLGCLVTLINPYAWRLHQWLLESLTIPRPEIVEWHPMHWTSEPLLAFLLLTAACIGGLIFTRSKRDWTHIALMGITLWQSVSHQRHLPFFAVMVCVWMPVHWISVWNRFMAWRSKHVEDSNSPIVQFGAIGCLVILNLVLAITVVGRFGVVDVRRNDYPVTAMQYIADQRLSGRMVVTYNWAQYAIGCFGQGSPGVAPIRVGFDGRFRTCYPLDLIDQHFDFILGNHPNMPRHRADSSPPPSPGVLLDRESPNLVLISRKQPHSTFVMEAHQSDWCLLYQDQLAQLWGRRSVYDDPEQSDFVDSHSRIVEDTPQTGVVSWPALPMYREGIARNGSKITSLFCLPLRFPQRGEGKVGEDLDSFLSTDRRRTSAGWEHAEPSDAMLSWNSHD